MAGMIRCGVCGGTGVEDRMVYDDNGKPISDGEGGFKVEPTPCSNRSKHEVLFPFALTVVVTAKGDLLAVNMRCDECDERGYKNPDELWKHALKHMDEGN